ncbi:MAG: YggT family protein [Steroidobacteraceae bacterium]
MLQVLTFLVDTFFSLLFLVFLLRLLLQWARADFRNPLTQAVVKLSNWLIMPLRRALPPVGRIDTASVVAVLLIAMARIAALSMVVGAGIPDLLTWLRLAGLEIIETVLWLYFWAIFVYALLGMIAPGAYSPVLSVLQSICEPVLRPIRRTIPSVAGLDLSPLWAGILIQVFLILLR